MFKNMIYILFIAFGTITAQIFLKKGLLLTGGIDFSSGVINEILRLLRSPFITGALILQGIMAIFWIWVMSKVQLVYLFTMSGAFFYILLALAAWLILGEKLSGIQWLGVFLISAGVVCFNYQPF